MPDLATIPTARRPELVLQPPSDGGQHIVKDPLTRAYYTLGELEYFLLAQLDGTRTAEAICAAFEAHFGQPLPPEDLDEFLALARGAGFLQPADGPGDAMGEEDASAPAAAPSGTRPRQSLLYWRRSLCDPDRLLNWLEPKLRFIWSTPFLVVSAGCILTAVVLSWANKQDLVPPISHVLRWETLVLLGLTVMVTTVCHEFAHGLTCKHYGGAVHDMGFLLIFLMPALYCNVSDSWLFREKSKRLWVTLAGGYCDLFLWSLATLAWRVTLPGSPPNHLAWVVLSVCGVRVFLNFNPLIKLDGYYFLSDLVEIPNLHRRGRACTMRHLHWLLWGAPRPARKPWGRFLLGFGTASWLFSLGFLVVMLAGFARYLGDQLGLAGVGATALLGGMTLPGLLRGVFSGEFKQMIQTRRKRAAMWGIGLALLPGILVSGRMEDRAGGTFKVRPVSRAEVRAPVAGFLREVYGGEGDYVSAGRSVARLEVPDLASRLTQARAGVRESQAKLQLLEAGPRPEELAQQRLRIERAVAWRDKAEQDLAQMQRTLQNELTQLDKQIARYRAEHDNAAATYKRAHQLLERRSISTQEYGNAETLHRASLAQLQQAEAEKLTRQSQGTLEAEAELGRREKDLAETRATLALLEAGTRPEEIEAERAHLAQLEEQVCYLEGLQDQILVYGSVSGVIITPHLRERIGQYFREGDLICEVESPSVLQAEIALSEQDVPRVRPGQTINLRARAFPLQAFHGRVERIAPGAIPFGTMAGGEQDPFKVGEVPSTVTVYCRLEGREPGLRPGMTGYARINCGRGPIGEVLANHVLRYLRTEFWIWW